MELFKKKKKKYSSSPLRASRNEKSAPAYTFNVAILTTFLIQAPFFFFLISDRPWLSPFFKKWCRTLPLEKIKFFMLPKSYGGAQNTMLGKFSTFLRLAFKGSKSTFTLYDATSQKPDLNSVMKARCTGRKFY